MEFAVVNTLNFMDHSMYEFDSDLMKELKNIDQLELLAKSNKSKNYIDYEKHVILPTSWELVR